MNQNCNFSCFKKYFNSFFLKGFKKIPSIRSVEQIDENTLKVSWDIDNYSGDLTRFRIFYSVIGDDNNEYFEWPGTYSKYYNYNLKKTHFCK